MIRPSKRNRACSSAALLAFAAWPALSFAQLPDWAPKPPPRVVEDRFRVEATLFNAGYDTKLRIDPSLTETGTELDAEDDLALDESELLMQGEITLLPGERHLLRLSGLSSRRSGQATLDEDIIFDDEEYFVDERVDSKLNLTMVGLTYGYRFIARDRGELTGTFGIQVTEVEANVVVRNRVIREDESGVAPLPLIGIEGRFDFTARWSVEGRLQYLTADIEEVDGEILDARLALTWRHNPYLVYGLGYRQFSIEIDSRDESTPGFVDATISGPLLFIRASL